MLIAPAYSLGESAAAWTTKWLRFFEKLWPDLRLSNVAVNQKADVLVCLERSLASVERDWGYSEGDETAQQIRTARLWVWCALRSNEGDDSLRQRLKEPAASFRDGLPEWIAPQAAYVRDCLRSFMGLGREVKAPIVVVNPGQVLQIVVEAHDGGTGLLYLHPSTPLLGELVGESLSESIKQAWAAAHAASGEHKARSTDCDVFWRIEQLSNKPLLRSVYVDTNQASRIEGRSASGAAARLFYHLLNGNPLDADCVVLGQVTPEDAKSTLETVSHLRTKAVLALRQIPFSTIIVTGPSERLAVLDAIRSEYSNSELEAQVKALSVSDTSTPDLVTLGRARSWLCDHLTEFYQSWIKRMDEPLYFPEGRVLTRAHLAIPPRVLRRKVRERVAPELPHVPSADAFLDPLRAEIYENPYHTDETEEVLWRVELPSVRRTVIKGGPGAGKSFLTLWTAAHLAKKALHDLRVGHSPPEELPIPLLFELNQDAMAFPEDPENAVTSWLGREMRFEPQFLKWFATRLKSPNTWIILDALDQAPGSVRIGLRKWLTRVDRDGWQGHLLVTVRTSEYDRSALPWVERTEVALAALRQAEDVTPFVSRWFPDDGANGQRLLNAIRASAALAEMSTNPLLLSFLCLAHSPENITSDLNRTRLYRRVFWTLYHDQWREIPERKLRRHAESIRQAVQQVAWTLFQRHGIANRFAESEFRTGLEQAGNHPQPLAEEDLIEELLKARLITDAGLDSDEKPQVAFIHRSFQDFLAAGHLATRVQAEGWPSMATMIDEHAFRPEWHAIIVFLAGQLADSTPLIELLADGSRDDLLHYRLVLAVECLGEAGWVESRGSMEGERSETCSTSLSNIGAQLTWQLWRNQYVALSASSNQSAYQVLFGNKKIFDLISRGVAVDVPFEVFRLAGSPKTTEALQPHQVQGLLQNLSHENTNIRVNVAKMLVDRGEAGADRDGILQALLAGLRDDLNSEVQICAARVLERMGEAAVQQPNVVAALVVCLRDEDENVQLRAAKALRSIGATAADWPGIVRALLAGLCVDDDDLNDDAIEFLGVLMNSRTPKFDIVDALLAGLRDEATDVRAGAALALGILGDKGTVDYADMAPIMGFYGDAVSDDPRIVDDLLVCLRDEEPNVRGRAAWALVNIGEKDLLWPEVIEALHGCMRDENCDFRFNAIQALKRLGEAGREQACIVAALLVYLQDEDENVRVVAVEALNSMGNCAVNQPGVAEALVLCMRDDAATEIRVAAAAALGQVSEMVARRAGVFEEMLLFLRDEDPVYRVRGSKVLGSMGEIAARHPTVVQALLECLCDDASEVRANAAEAFGRMGTAAASHPAVIAALLACLSDQDSGVRVSAVKAFRMMGELAAGQPGVIAALLVSLSDGKTQVRLEAISAMESMGQTAVQKPAIIQSIVAVLKNGDLHGSMRVTRLLETLVDGAVVAPEFQSLLNGVSSGGDNNGLDPIKATHILIDALSALAKGGIRILPREECGFQAVRINVAANRQL